MNNAAAKKHSQVVITSEEQAELQRLREENKRLKEANRMSSDYIRRKVNDLLTLIGTRPIGPEELDDQGLLETDPIGVVTHSFEHVLTNLRVTNQNLRFAHDEIQAIFNTVGSALLVLDPQKRVIAYNQKTRELLIGDDRDIHGCNCEEAICNHVGEKSRCMFEKVMRTGREQQTQDWCLRHQSFSVIGTPILNDAGAITHVVLSYSDITERRNAETALLAALNETQDANAKIRSILRSASDCMLIVDAEERLVLLNHRAEELLGFCLANKYDNSSIDILPHSELIGLLQRTPEAGPEGIEQDLVFLGPGGKERIYQARVSAIHSAQGEYRGGITFLHDVTQQRELDNMKNDFVSTAAHELRTPLSTIIGYTDLLLTQEAQVEEHLHDYLGLIQNRAERLADIVSDLLDISRIESGDSLQLNPEPVNIHEVCEDVLSAFRNQARQHHYALEGVDPQPEILVDRYSIVQILENLVGNSVKYSPPGTMIQLVIRQDGDSCHVQVADQGIGMTADQLERVFDKFYRADATNTAISGTGLGMTIVKYLVEAQAGWIEIESQPNRGTTVHIRLPLINSARSTQPIGLRN